MDETHGLHYVTRDERARVDLACADDSAMLAAMPGVEMSVAIAILEHALRNLKRVHRERGYDRT